MGSRFGYGLVGTVASLTAAMCFVGMTACGDDDDDDSNKTKSSCEKLADLCVQCPALWQPGCQSVVDAKDQSLCAAGIDAYTAYGCGGTATNTGTGTYTGPTYTTSGTGTDTGSDTGSGTGTGTGTGACITCGVYYASCSATVLFADDCTADPNDICAGDSAAKFNAVYNCVCDSANCLSDCPTLCASGGDDTNCATCINTAQNAACNGDAQDCAADI